MKTLLEWRGEREKLGRKHGSESSTRSKKLALSVES